MRKVNESYKRTKGESTNNHSPDVFIGCAMSHAWSYGESSSDKLPIIDSNKSEAYPGTIPMIKYWGGDKCDLFRFDFEAEDERL